MRYEKTLSSHSCVQRAGGSKLRRRRRRNHRQTDINGFDVTVFASPVPLRAGPVDVSVLVQRGEKAILDAAVEVAWRRLSSSSLAASVLHNGIDADRIPALRAHSNNSPLLRHVP